MTPKAKENHHDDVMITTTLMLTLTPTVKTTTTTITTMITTTTPPFAVTPTAREGRKTLIFGSIFETKEVKTNERKI